MSVSLETWPILLIKQTPEEFLLNSETQLIFKKIPSYFICVVSKFSTFAPCGHSNF